MERRIASADRGVLAFTPATRNVAGFLFVLMLPLRLDAADFTADPTTDSSARRPLPMFGPTSQEDCAELALQWTRYVDGKRQAHRACHARAATAQDEPITTDSSGDGPPPDACARTGTDTSCQRAACGHRTSPSLPACRDEADAYVCAQAQRDAALNDCEAALAGYRKQQRQDHGHTGAGPPRAQPPRDR